MEDRVVFVYTGRLYKFLSIATMCVNLCYVEKHQTNVACNREVFIKFSSFFRILYLICLKFLSNRISKKR